jgi:predicted RNA-binding protein
MDLEKINKIKALDQAIRREQDRITRESSFVDKDNKIVGYKMSRKNELSYNNMTSERNKLVEELSPENQDKFRQPSSSKKPSYPRRIFSSSPKLPTTASAGASEINTTSFTR